MDCLSCGTRVQEGHKFCPGCGSPLVPQVCPGCGRPIEADSSFCPSCGQALKSKLETAKSNPAPTGITSDLKDLAPGEVVLMDTGFFPITFVKNIASSVNGKLYLTNQRLVFKAGKLQGVGGTSVGGVFIPNPKDASKSKEHFVIPLSEITAVASGWASLTVHAREKYKFGGMRKTKEWQEAIGDAMKH